MHKKIFISILLLAFLATLSGCGKDIIKMSQDEFAKYLANDVAGNDKYIKHDYTEKVNGGTLLSLYAKTTSNQNYMIYDGTMKIYQKVFKKDIDEVIIYWQGENQNYNIAKLGITKEKFDNINWDTKAPQDIPNISTVN